jgi:hypothetical protein
VTPRRTCQCNAVKSQGPGQDAGLRVSITRVTDSVNSGFISVSEPGRGAALRRLAGIQDGPGCRRPAARSVCPVIFDLASLISFRPSVSKQSVSQLKMKTFAYARSYIHFPVLFTTMKVLICLAHGLDSNLNIGWENESLPCNPQFPACNKMGPNSLGRSSGIDSTSNLCIQESVCQGETLDSDSPFDFKECSCSRKDDEFLDKIGCKADRCKAYGFSLAGSPEICGPLQKSQRGYSIPCVIVSNTSICWQPNPCSAYHFAELDCFPGSSHCILPDSDSHWNISSSICNAGYYQQGEPKAAPCRKCTACHRNATARGACANRTDAITCVCGPGLAGTGLAADGDAACRPCPAGTVPAGAEYAPAFTFEAMLSAAGNRSASLALALLPWVPAAVSLEQSAVAIAHALAAAGVSFDAPCQAAVPFLALPGLILSTVPGAVYPAGFAVAVTTSRPPIAAAGQPPLVSAVTTFVAVRWDNRASAAAARAGNASNASAPQVRMEGFPIGSARRAAAACNSTAGEWRYTPINTTNASAAAASRAACGCPANSPCGREATACDAVPGASAAWAVVGLPPSFCAANATPGAGGGGGLAFNDQLRLALGLGIGLGVGVLLPALAGTGWLARRRIKERVTVVPAQAPPAVAGAGAASSRPRAAMLPPGALPVQREASPRPRPPPPAAGWLAPPPEALAAVRAARPAVADAAAGGASELWNPTPPSATAAAAAAATAVTAPVTTTQPGEALRAAGPPPQLQPPLLLQLPTAAGPAVGATLLAVAGHSAAPTAAGPAAGVDAPRRRLVLRPLPPVRVAPGRAGAAGRPPVYAGPAGPAEPGPGEGFLPG